MDHPTSDVTFPSISRPFPPFSAEFLAAVRKQRGKTMNSNAYEPVAMLYLLQAYLCMLLCVAHSWGLSHQYVAMCYFLSGTIYWLLSAQYIAH
jgi:hypothetical protein